VCGILHDLTGIADTDLCVVQPDACASCCRWFAPTTVHLNPVVASLLFNLSADVARRGGVAGCNRQHAERLKQRAAESIPDDRDWGVVAEEAGGGEQREPLDVEAVVPRPAHRSGLRVREWAVGVTTAPRDQPTLEACLASLSAAGWREPRLFVDGNAVLPPAAHGLPVTRRDPRIGAWPSYYLALAELIMRAPHADAYLLVQDDVLFYRHTGLRRYVESILWPGKRPGLVSLFCSRAYTQPVAGWHVLTEPLVWGGQAIIFPHDAALAFLGDAQVLLHRLAPEPDGLANIDGLIGQWACRTRTSVSVPTPSLAQHIGQVSALWPEARAFGNRRADQFAGDRDST
jgi:hypothetical protein